MSTRKIKNKKKYPFNEIWNRIKEKTSLEKYNELAEVVETAQSNVSKRRKENIFPPEWGFKIAQKYGLCTDWIMTGIEPKKRKKPDSSYQNKILHEIDKWLSEQIKKEPFRKEWFMGTFLDAFPKFAKWKRSQGSQSEDNRNNNSKAA